MLDSIYHMILKFLLNRIFVVNMARFTSFLRKIIWTSLRNVSKSCLSILLHGIISLNVV